MKPILSAIAAVIAAFAAPVLANDLPPGPPADRDAALKALTVPSFTEEAAAAGIDQLYAGGFNFFVGGGGSSLDCNDDGFPDLVL
ncbi:MAG TPA: hypothetical protein VFO41_02540, partial [Alphaproteobacteria bacterium]|nr:hypothetical protein [Alphaproteobacteria bacterium]